MPGSLTSRGFAGSGFQPAMVRAHSRACALSVTPGNRRRSSTAADSSPCCSNAAPGAVTLGNGGEIAIGTKEMRPFINTVRARPDMLAIDASRQRMELADKADVLTLGVDAAATIQAENSLEKMLAHQMAAAHRLAMELQVEARELLRLYKHNGYIHQSLAIEAGRLFSASARMMDTFQHGLLTFAKIRSGGQQTVVVQHVNVGDGGRAMVAGQVKSQSKARTAKVEGGEPKNER